MSDNEAALRRELANCEEALEEARQSGDYSDWVYFNSRVFQLTEELKKLAPANRVRVITRRAT